MADTPKIPPVAARPADRVPAARPALRGDWTFKGEHHPLLRWLPRASN